MRIRIRIFDKFFFESEYELEYQNQYLCRICDSMDESYDSTVTGNSISGKLFLKFGAVGQLTETIISAINL